MPDTEVVVVGAGQAGLAAARALLESGLRPLILEAGERAAGSWPHYYDSLRSFSPAAFSSMPGLPFPGKPDGYPSRDEVAAYLEAYAATLDAEIRKRTRVTSVRRPGRWFVVETADGRTIEASGIVVASGSFGNPYRPHLPGSETFGGEVLHVGDYRNPQRYAGRRVVVVGGGDSAVQVAADIATVAKVTISSRRPLRIVPQVIDGRDMHHWLRETGFDSLPAEWLLTLTGGTFVTDSGGYAEQLAARRFDCRPMFTCLAGDGIVWSDGGRERVDAVVLATGYRPNVDLLRPLGALDESGMPLHAGGISTTHIGLVFVGLEYQRCYASNTLRGVSDDARAVVAPLVAAIRDAPQRIGLA